MVPELLPATILLADDDEDIRSIVRRVLVRQGYRVLEACDGAEALSLASRQERPIDLLLTDIMMPNMNGIKLAEHLRQERPELKVLYVSGYIEGELASAASLDGLLLRKPFTPEELVRRIRDLLRPAA